MNRSISGMTSNVRAVLSILILLAVWGGTSVLHAQDSGILPVDSAGGGVTVDDSTVKDSLLVDSLTHALSRDDSKQVPDRAAIAMRGLRTDSADIVSDSALRRKIDRYRSDPAFDYERKREGQSLMQRFLAWLRDLMGGSSGGGETGGFGFLDVLGWIALAVVVCVIVVVVAGIRKSFLRPARRLVTGMTEVGENIHEMDFDRLIAEMVGRREYRRAVRLLYLNALKRLTDRGLIQWKIDKTNHEYLRELRTSRVIEPFRRATLAFEYVWYGDLPVDEANFPKIRDLFARLDQSLSDASGSSTSARP